MDIHEVIRRGVPLGLELEVENALFREGPCDDVDGRAAEVGGQVGGIGFKDVDGLDDVGREEIQLDGLAGWVGRGDLGAVERGGDIAVGEAAHDGVFSVHDVGAGDLRDRVAGVAVAGLGEVVAVDSGC